MNKYMKYLILLNCKLIEDDVRECFLFWCKKTHNIKSFIFSNFPNLYINEHVQYVLYKEFKTCDMVLVSKRYVDATEFNTNSKLGKLLGYLSADKFDNLNRDLITYSYTFYAKIKNENIALFNELSQNKLDHSIMLNKINESLKNIVDKIELEERIIIPVVYLIQKIENNKNLNDEELDELKNCLWNEKLDKIYNIKNINNLSDL